MGNWRITIDGTGIHHNGTKAIVVEVHNAPPYEDETTLVEQWVPAQPNDANVLFQEFVDKLKAAGHAIHQTSFQVLGQIEYYGNR